MEKLLTTNSIATLGFPITMCIILLVGIYRVGKPIVQHVLEAVDKVVETNRQLTDTNIKLSYRLDIMESDIKEIKDIVKR